MVSKQFFASYEYRIEPYFMAHEHFHDRYEIYYLLSGERYYFIENERYLVTPGDLILIDRYAVHKTSDASQGEHERILIEFNESFLGEWWKELEQFVESVFHEKGKQLRLEMNERDYLASAMKRVVMEAKRETVEAGILVKALLVDILIFVHRMKGEELEPERPRHPQDMKVAEVLNFIGRHYRTPELTLERVSQKFYISKYHLSRLFKEKTGYTLTEYVTLLRIRDAESLLRETNLKIIDIADRIGFQHVSHFWRMFKRHSGLSPREYRKRLLG